MSRDSELTADTPSGTPHFIEIAAARGELTEPALLEAELRRIGLRPRAITTPCQHPGHAGCSTGWQVHFGAIAACLESVPLDPSRVGKNVAVCLRVRPNRLTDAQDAVADSRELFKLAVLLIDLVRGQRFYWSPADLWSDAVAFRAAVAEMLDSGMPPVLHLVAFVDDADQCTTDTCGLAHFCGQELSLGASAGLDKVARMRRLVRLAVDMMLNGRIVGARRFAGLAAGEYIEVVPDVAMPGCPQRVRVRLVGA